MTNCPNCGAPIQTSVCEYCGTVFNMDILHQKMDEYKTLQEKIRQLENTKHVEELYANAIKAMRSYAFGDI